MYNNNTRTHSWLLNIDVHNKCHITHHQPRPWIRTTDLFQVKMEWAAAAAVLLFFVTFRQFPFYLYPNRGYSGPPDSFYRFICLRNNLCVCDCFFFRSFLFYFSCSIFSVHCTTLHIISMVRAMVRLQCMHCVHLQSIYISICTHFFISQFAIAIPMHCLHM